MLDDKNTLILLVDDQPDNLDVLIEYLASQNIALSVTLNGEEAVELACQLHPELILLDVMMPDMVGFETCRQLKLSASTRDIPVLFMTASNDTIDRLEGFYAGGVDYITKPLQHEEVLAKIKTHLTIRRQQQALAEKNRELEEKNQLIAAQIKQLEIIACIDPLTQLANRRGFLELVEREQARCARGTPAFSIILSDIDHFKRINDRYGHDNGDEVLRKIAKRLRELSRQQDISVRWGGEEFILLLPETDLDAAFQVAERICAYMAEHPIVCEEQPLAVTMSFGVAEYTPGSSFDTCIKQADEALYRAKQRGRNRVERMATALAVYLR